MAEATLQAKTNRSSAKRLLTISIKDLDEAMNGNRDTSVVSNKYDNLLQRWSNVMEKHSTYIAHAYPDESKDPDIVDEEWIQTCFKSFNEVEKKYESFLKASIACVDIQQKVKPKKTANVLRFEKSTLESNINSLNAVVKDEDASESTIVEARNKMREQRSSYQTKQREFVELLSDDEDVEKQMKLMSQMESLYIEADLKAGKSLKKFSKKSQLPDTDRKRGVELKLERMKLPTFSGRIRDYPSFRYDFKQHVLPHLKDDQSIPYILKSCLTGEPSEIVRNVDDDIKEMWTRLDEKYGRTSLQINAIMKPIKQLKAIQDGDGKRFVELVNIIESSHRDLLRLNIESEISNSTIISEIEQKLPPRIYATWCLDVSDRHSKIDECNKFPQFLEFLLKHKRAVEYGSSELRTAKHVNFVSEANVQHVTKGDTTQNDSAKVNINNDERKVGCWLHVTNQHEISECRAFHEESVIARWDLVSDYRACWCCLKSGHRLADCYKLKECGVNGCKDRHHPLLHEEKDTEKRESEPRSAIQKHIADKNNASKFCLLQLMEVNAGAKQVMPLNTMWDSGAQLSLITFKKAKELELTGVKTKLSIIKVGAEKEIVDSKLYEIPLHDVNGNIESFQAYGIDKISTSIEAYDTSSIAKLFNIAASEVTRPEGEIDMLIGYEYAGFHPDKEKSVNHLVLLKNKFGRCFGGTHETMIERATLLIQEARVAHAAIKIEDFYNTEALGVACVPKCGSCRCGECSMGSKPYTLKEERELVMIDQGLELQEDRWVARYPWIKNPNDLPDNYTAAYAMLKSTERRLRKDQELTITYNDQITDMIERGVARKLTESELSSYTGPAYYLSHHEVINEDSKSTPCRIVFNSSARFLNQTLNDYWGKGPDMMNNLLGVLLRFRSNKVAIAGDISKMYHAVGISQLDQHTHRFLWRDINSGKPDVYIMTAVSFGDKPAAAIAGLALKKTAIIGKENFPEAANTIINNSYVDDLLDSFDDQPKALQVASEIEKILGNCGFRIKEWVISGEAARDGDHEICTLSANSQVGTGNTKVLGIVWNPRKDQFSFSARVNFSQKKRKIHTMPNLTEVNLVKSIPLKLTRRMILSQVNGIYDPIGLAVPFTVTGKMLLRKLTSEKFDWDDPTPEEERISWVNFFVQMFAMEKITFHRSTKPQDAVGDPTLIIFSDASQEAFGTCAYIRWEKEDGSYESRLIAAKSRLAPIKRITMPRLELNGALMAARIQQFIVKEIPSINFRKKYFIVDSEIVRAMIQKESYGFNTFAGVRIGEIQAATEKTDWYWVESSLNIADIISRGSPPSRIGINSEWQTGPVFLKQPENEWPVKQSYSGKEIPDQIIMSCQVGVETVQKNQCISNTIDINRYSSYDKLIRVTARVSAIFEHEEPSLKHIAKLPNRDRVKTAEKRWICHAQSDIQSELKPEAWRRLNIKEIDGIYVVGGRLETWQDHTYNSQSPILLSSKSRLAQLYARKIHNECHLGVSAVTAKIREKFWIVGLRNLVRSIRYKCTLCRRLDKSLQEQTMGEIPAERLKPAPAWSYTSVDYFGPFEIRGEVNKRTRGKAYGVLFNCLLSRAVHLEAVSDYSTNSFLLAIRRFMAIRGCPIKVWSDRGTQLVAASKEMKPVIVNHDMESVTTFGSKNSIDWSFNSPDAPWQNGCAEALVKSAKKAITIAIGSQVLSFTEMQTVLCEAANLLNERPIGRHPTSTEDGSYLSPNDLLLGRSTNKVSGDPFISMDRRYTRYKFVQKVITAFWNKWNRDFFPSLTVRQKWHTARRNVQVGDVVLIQDSNQIRGKWKLGRVSQADPSLRDGFVRNVEIKYKNEGTKTYTTVDRPVQRIIVLVPVNEDEN